MVKSFLLFCPSPYRHLAIQNLIASDTTHSMCPCNCTSLSVIFNHHSEPNGCPSLVFERTNDGVRGLFVDFCFFPWWSVRTTLKQKIVVLFVYTSTYVHRAMGVMSPRWAVTINPYLRHKQVSSLEEAIILQSG